MQIDRSQQPTRRRNVFVLGLNEFNLDKLRSIRGAERCAFHGLLAPEEILDAEHYPVEQMLERAGKTLTDFPGPVDAVVGYMDFPVSTILPLLAERFGLRSVSMTSLLKCEHKYWSRLQQREAVPDHVPAFAAFDPFAPDALSTIGLPFPFWIKPVKSAGSWLGFRINSAADFERATAIIRQHIGRFADPFNYILAQADLPPEVAEVDGHYCLAEQILSGRQCTVEGCVFDGEVQVHGIVDSVRNANRVSFNRYEYPSRLPVHVRDRMREISRRILTYVGFDNAAYNIEYFWNPRADTVRLLEVNTRIAQHHSDLFEKVNGVSNHQFMVDVALGQRPEPPSGQGPFRRAAACFLRRYRDGVVTRVPGDEEIAELEAEIPGLVVEPHVKPGDRLSELVDQDSYSYVLALLYIGADSTKQLMQRYHHCERALTFEFTDPEPAAVGPSR